MRFESLAIQNLRAIANFKVDDLKDFIVIAGQNGSGKSCVLDAIRLLKSLYGGYLPNEYHQWFGEFAINVNEPDSFISIFRNPELPVEVEARISFSESELQYIGDNAEKLALPMAWQQVTGQALESWQFSLMSVVTQLEQQRNRLAPEIDRIATQVRSEIRQGSQHIGVTFPPSGQLELRPSKLVELAFQTFDPVNLGVIDHHSASRSYARQPLGGINLDARTFESQRRTSSLYNAQTKYQNIKSELATGYIHDLIIADTGASAISSPTLNQTLTELFNTFFPDKSYQGVAAAPDGSLTFPVTLASGRTHDIDDLSSGEKEILYGYLRLRGATPPHSVLLLDEPELHLNPGLLHGFADFYYRHLGEARGNQLWLVTHSDTLLRQAVGNPHYTVFHMTSAAATDPGNNQANEVNLSQDVERATMDLVGDLATYRPHSKVVILEGDGVDGFDVTVVRRLFPDFAKKVNLVSGGNKARVGDLYALLADSTQQIAGENRFFAVTDMDRAPRAPGSNHMSWDRYHIENYLLDPQAIRLVSEAVSGRSVFVNDDAVLQALRVSARELVGSLAIEIVQEELNDSIVSSVRIGAAPNSSSPETALAASMSASASRVNSVKERFTEAAIRTSLDEKRSDLESSLENDDWMSRFPGRNILKRFTSQHLNIGYEPFINLVLDEMSKSRIAPQQMNSVLQRILDA